MDRKQTLVVCLLLATAAALITWKFTAPQGQPKPAQGMQLVLTTQRPFRALAPLDAGGLEVKWAPLENVPAEAVTLLDAVKDRYAGRPLEAGAILRQSDLWAGKALDLTQEIPAGRRALNIQVERGVNFGKDLQPGQWVDVVGTFPKDRLVIQGGQVLGVYHPPGKTDRMLVTLAVPAANVQSLIEAEKGGKLRLVLRPPPAKEGVPPSKPPAASQALPATPTKPTAKPLPTKAAPSGKAKVSKPAPKPAASVRKAPRRVKGGSKPFYRRRSSRS